MGQETEDMRQRTGDRGWGQETKDGDRRQGTEDRGQRTGVSGLSFSFSESNKSSIDVKSRMSSCAVFL